jgi:hypothetical protein
MSADCFTLDDYIKKKNIDGSLSLMNLRKKKLNIDENELDASLDEINRKNAAKRGLKCGISKFDRFNDDSGNQSDNEDDDEDEISSGSDYRKSYEKINNDMEMMDISEQSNIQAENSSIRFAKEIQNMDHPECCRIKKHFTTVESAMGIKMKSQQWRVENPNSDDRSDKVLNGRVQKNYKKNGTNGPKAGIFIEKGNFTYKFNDDPSNDIEDNAESIVGIVRNRPVTKIIRVGNNNGSSNNYNNRNVNNNFRNRQNGNGSSPVNINMNWNGFFKGMTECIKTVAPATQPLERKANGASANQDIQVKIAATELFDFLLAKRDKSNNKVSFSEPPQKMPDPVNEYIVSATAGNGIDMDVTPAVTNMPMNLRFA